MADAPDILSSIRIAKIQFCHDDTCQLSSDLHLKIEYKNVELSKSLAVAVSYTWGEFERRDVFIGHDAQGTPISLNLGQEWNVRDTIVRLAMLCIENGQEHGTEHAGLWIDQLCIRQTSAEIRATLASIPTIYRTLEVIILMPGGSCGCLQQYAALAGSIKDNNFPKPQDSLSMMNCVNIFGLCSYFDRVWTRQELMYSRSVRVARVALDEIGCARHPAHVGMSAAGLSAAERSATADISNLSGFAKRLYTKYLREGYSSLEAFTKLMTASIDFFSKAVSSLSSFQGPSAKGGQLNVIQDGFLLALDFLLERKLTQKAANKSKLDAFLWGLYKLGESTRRTTKARDLVASVWVDCPGYVLPDKYKEMCLPSLLEDAIRQLETKHGLTLQVSAFAGLLGQSLHQSSLWRPRMYLGWKRIENAAQVYRVILQNSPIPVTWSGDIPLIVFSPSRVALSQLALEYSEIFRLASVIDVLKALQPIFENFTSDMHSRILHSSNTDLFFPADRHNVDVGATVFLGKLLVCTTPVPIETDVSLDVDDRAYSENFDHHQIVYRLVAISFGLDPSYCQSRGLKLMVVVNHCIGLVAPDILDVSRDVITVSTSSLRSNPNQDHPKNGGELMLEAVKTADEPFLSYRAAGIWVPHGRRNAFSASAYIEPEYPNALLG